ncbi:hypothetical protein ISCGN_010582 [Ixodes scapularis]
MEQPPSVDCSRPLSVTQTPSSSCSSGSGSKRRLSRTTWKVSWTYSQCHHNGTPEPYGVYTTLYRRTSEALER